MGIKNKIIFTLLLTGLAFLPAGSGELKAGDGEFWEDIWEKIIDFNHDRAVWKLHDSNPLGHRFQENERRLSSRNVSNLKLVKSFPVSGAVLKTPTVDENYVYFADLALAPPNAVLPSHIYKTDRDLNLIWSRSLEEIYSECRPGENPLPLLITQTAVTIAGDKLLIGTGLPNSPIVFPAEKATGYVIAIDKRSGRCEWITQMSEPESPLEGVQSSIAVHDGFAYVTTTSNEEESANFLPGFQCCSTIGKICKVNLRNGNKIWCEPMIDPEGDPSTPEDDLPVDALAGYSGATIYASPSVAIDLRNRQVIAVTANLYSRGTNVEAEDLNPFHLASDSIVALDMHTGRKNWVHRTIPEDVWTFSCIPLFGGGCWDGDPETPCNCPDNPGQNYSMSAGPVLMRGIPNETGVDFDGDGRVEHRIDVVAGRVKDGTVVMVEAKTGALVARPEIGRPVLVGLGGFAYNEEHLYAVSECTLHLDFSDFPNVFPTPRDWTLQGGPNAGQTVFGGTLSALDPATGEILWQNADPRSFIDPGVLFGDPAASFNPINSYLGPPSAAADLVFAGSAYGGDMSAFFGFPLLAPGPTMFAYHADTGELLWSFDTQNESVASGPAIADGQVYWGSGMVFPGGKVYLFELRKH